MTEFPWEIKKGSEARSQGATPPAGELPAFLTGKGGGNEPERSGLSIPDILANAFAGAPMEEMKIEMPVFDKRPAEQSPPFIPPGFQNISESPGFIGADINKNKSPEVPHALFNPSSPPTGMNEDTKAKKTARKSPPPIFKLKTQDDTELEKEEHATVGAMQRPPLPFTMGTDEKNAETLPPFLAHASVSAMKDPNLTIQPNAMQAPGPFSAPPSITTDKVAPMDTFNTAPASSPFTPPAQANPFNPAPASSPFTPPAQAAPFNPATASSPFTPPAQATPFNPAPASSPFTPPAQANPFNPAPASSPFTPPAQATPFNPALASSPFTPPAQANPFNPAPASSPFTPPAQANPFNPAPASSPFAPPPQTNPFGPTPASQAFPQTNGQEPFHQPRGAPFDPFAGAMKTPAPGSAEYGLGSKQYNSNIHGPMHITMDGLKKKVEIAGKSVRSLLIGMTAGKSLMERMGDMRGDTGNAVPTNKHSPFVPNTVQTDPFSSQEPPKYEIPGTERMDSIHRAPVTAPNSTREAPIYKDTDMSNTVDSIRTVTPLDEPLMELKEEDKIDLFQDDTENTEEEITIQVPKAPVKIEKTSRAPMKDDGAADSSKPMFSDDALNMIEQKQIDEISMELKGTKDEIEDALARIANIDSNVLGFSTRMEELDSKIAGLRADDGVMGTTVTRLDRVDEKISSLEAGLENMRADNSDIRGNLSRIEEGIAELVNSYTALLVQMHESSQSSDERFSRIEEALIRLSPVEERLCTLEKQHNESRSMTMEMTKSISSIMDGMGATTGELRELKESSELSTNKLRENLSLMTEYVDSELRKMGARSSRGHGQSVHLSSITKNSSNMKLCMEWLEFLMGLVGRNNLPDILSYYEELGWITEQVRSELMHYAEGIDFYMEKPDWKLTPDDHVKSIWFIESLAGLKVDKNRLSVIDRDIEKVKKGTEIYGI